MPCRAVRGGKTDAPPLRSTLKLASGEAVLVLLRTRSERAAFAPHKPRREPHLGDRDVVAVPLQRFGHRRRNCPPGGSTIVQPAGYHKVGYAGETPRVFQPQYAGATRLAACEGNRFHPRARAAGRGRESFHHR